MNILLADDHELVRDTLAAFLVREPNVNVSTAADFTGAVKNIRMNGPFDIVLLDYNMPGMNGLEGLKKASEINNGNPIAIISGTASQKVAEEALSSGAMGFLPKNMAAKSLVNALKFMIAGEKFAPLEFMTMKEKLTENPLSSLLTKRELEVLDGLMKGFSNKEIARATDLQEVTIKLHVKTLCRKLGARNRTHAAIIGTSTH